MADSVFLDGVVLANYRGIGADVQYISGFGKFNFFIGPNNSGKSTVLHFLSNHLDYLITDRSTKKIVGRRKEKEELKELDINLGSHRNSVLMGVGIKADQFFDEIAKINQMFFNTPKAPESLRKLLDKISKDGLIWFHGKGSSKEKILIESFLENSKRLDYLSESEWRWACHGLTGTSSSSNVEHNIKHAIEYIIRVLSFEIPEVSFIPAIRQISSGDGGGVDFSGKGLIKELAKHQNPGPLERERFKIFEKINKFLGTVIDVENAKIEVTHGHDQILVHVEDRVLPLENLGTGIHELIMLAAFCTMQENKILCIEEPEIHLHPVLQRRFVNYLNTETSNQYFIATHSPSLIDFPGAVIYKVANDNGATTINSSLKSYEMSNLFRDLGYRASDLLQSNSIIWVEGPSDRVYINHWIKSVAPELREGIEYSVMFYGGRLLSHLTAADAVDESEVGTFIELCRLNRNLAVVIDSDRSSQSEEINATKKRIFEEINQGDGVAWITEGREIENYIKTELMELALSEVCKRSFSERLKKGRFDHVLPFRRKDGKIQVTVDKVAVANFISTQSVDLSVLDLQTKVTQIVEMIRRANRH